MRRIVISTIFESIKDSLATFIFNLIMDLFYWIFYSLFYMILFLIDSIGKIINFVINFDLITTSLTEYTNIMDKIVAPLLVLLIIIMTLVYMVISPPKIAVLIKRIIVVLIALSFYAFFFDNVILLADSFTDLFSDGFDIATDYANSVFTINGEKANLENISELPKPSEWSKITKLLSTNDEIRYYYSFNPLLSLLGGVLLTLILAYFVCKLVIKFAELTLYFLIGKIAVVFGIVDGGNMGLSLVANFVRDCFSVGLMIMQIGIFIKLLEVYNDIRISSDSLNILESALLATVTTVGLAFFLLDGSSTINKVFNIDTGISAGTGRVLLNQALHSSRNTLGRVIGNSSKNGYAGTGIKGGIQKTTKAISSVSGINAFKNGAKAGFNNSRLGRRIDDMKNSNMKYQKSASSFGYKMGSGFENKDMKNGSDKTNDPVKDINNQKNKDTDINDGSNTSKVNSESKPEQDINSKKGNLKVGRKSNYETDKENKQDKKVKSRSSSENSTPKTSNKEMNKKRKSSEKSTDRSKD